MPNICTRCNTELKAVTVVSLEAVYTAHVCPHCEPDMIEVYQKRSEQAMVKRLTNMGIPRKYLTAELNSGMYNADFLNFKKGAIWFGASGTGKTWQMVGAIRRAILHNRKVAYADWTSMLCELKCNPNEYLKLLSIPNADVIAIDDFEVDNGFTFNYVYDFIKKLYYSDKIVYMTCSVLPAQDKIAMRLGEITSQYEVTNVWK